MLHFNYNRVCLITERFKVKRWEDIRNNIKSKLAYPILGLGKINLKAMNTCPHKNLCMNIHSNINRNSQNVDRTKCL